MRSVISIVMLAALTAGGFWWFAHSSAPSAPDPAISQATSQPAPVIVTLVRLQAERLEFDAVGTSRARQSVTLYPETAGRVTQIHFRAGEQVEEGQILLELEADDERIALQLAEVNIADARRVIDRYDRAQGTGAIPQLDVEAAQTTLQSAILERDRARVALADRTLRAPFAGVVGLTDIDPGDRVDPTTAITTLDNRESLLVNFEVPEAVIGVLQSGQAIELSPWNTRNKTVTGELVDLGARIDPVSRTVQARALVDNTDDQLRPGMSFRVALRIEGSSYPLVPEVSLQWGADGSYVWEVVDGTARQVPVDIVQRSQGSVLVEADLEPGDAVVSEGMQSMRPDKSVEIVNTAGPTAMGTDLPRLLHDL